MGVPGPRTALLCSAQRPEKSQQHGHSRLFINCLCGHKAFALLIFETFLCKYLKCIEIGDTCLHL